MITLEALVARLGQDKWETGTQYQGQTIMVTGAGGSIGSALCTFLALQGVSRLVLVELNEFSLYEINRKLVSMGVVTKPVLGSYGSPRLQKVLEDYEPTLCFHAGAYKHVPMVEENSLSAVDNNVLEAHSLFTMLKNLRAPISLVVISTDKAVKPANVMGATKALVEHMALSMVEGSKVVRFGNVIGSSGSVIPLFYEQLSLGMPVTITDMSVTRFFMSIPEAVSLVTSCNQLQGQRFLLTMGEPKKIAEVASWVAEQMQIPLKIKEIGLRPGEKLHEELCTGETEKTENTEVLRVRESVLSLDKISESIETLRKVQDHTALITELENMEIGYEQQKPFDRLSILGLPRYDSGPQYPNCFQTPSP
jgi:FlaA1/EpsC-like NDP-sugar epimerase